MPLSATLRSGFCLTEAALAERFHATEKAPSTRFVPVDDVRAIQVDLAELSAGFGSLVAEAGLDPQIIDSRTKLVPFTAVGRLIALAADCQQLGLLIGERVTLASQWLRGFDAVQLRHGRGRSAGPQGTSVRTGPGRRGRAGRLRRDRRTQLHPV